MNVGTLVVRSGRRHGDAVAVDDGVTQLTFAEVADRTVRLARALLAHGLEPGDRVLDLQTNSADYVVSDYAISAAGLVRVALNYRHTANDWLRIAEDCRPKAIIFADRFREAAAGLLELVPLHIVVGEAEHDEFSMIELAQAGKIGPLPDVTPDALVSLNYSSGTTGRPKGALRTHRNRLASLTNIVTDILCGLPAADDVWVHAGPLTHASGLFSLPHFTFGAKQLVLPEWDPAAFVDAVCARGATGSVLVPTMVARLLASDRLPDDGLGGLRRLVYAGAPMPPEQIRETLRRVTPNLVQMYGLVEAIPPITVLSREMHREGVETPGSTALSSAGRACFGVELRIVDAEGHDVADDEIGEVITRGDHTMAGYWGGGDATVVKAVVDGWLHTGDLGRLHDGHLYLVDRKGDMIISGGYNIYPREVEDVIAEVELVEQVAVVGVPDPEWGQRVVAFVTVAAGEDLDPAEIDRRCRERLASYKKPKEIHVIDEMPLGATGKIAKKALLARMSGDAGAQ